MRRVAQALPHFVLRMVGPHCTERPDARKQDTMSDKARLWVYSPPIVCPAATVAAAARILVAEKPSIFSTYVAVVESFERDGP